jgi:hypothetical protein
LECSQISAKTTRQFETIKDAMSLKKKSLFSSDLTSSIDEPINNITGIQLKHRGRMVNQH